MRVKTIVALAPVLIAVGSAALGQSFNRLDQSLQNPSGSAAAADSTAANEKGYLGAELDDVGEQGKGVRVTKVTGTPAQRSGLQAGDLITAINGKPVTNVDAYDELAKGPPNTKFQMTIDRSGKQQTLTVTLGTRPPQALGANPAPESDSPSLIPSVGSPSATPPAISARTSEPLVPGASAPGTPVPGSRTTSPGSPSLFPPTGSSSTTPGATTPVEPEATPRSPGIRAQPLELGPAPTDAPPAPPGLGSSSLTNPSSGSRMPSASAPTSPTAPSASNPAGGGGGSLGITVEAVTPDSSVGRGVPSRRGAIITAIKPGSPADQVGLPLGSIIVAIDGNKIESADELVRAIRAARVGQEVELSYYDGPTFGKKNVRLGPPAATAAPGVPSFPPARSGLASPGPAVTPGSGTAPGSFAAPGGIGGSLTPAAGGPRNLMGRVERMVDNFSRGGVGPAQASTVYDPLAMAALQQSVAELTNAVHSLEERLKVIERAQGGTTSNPAPASSSFGSPGSAGTGFGTAPAPPGTTP
jgi:membrane-associated protease RseP (regulator of RpoE activity)